MSEATIPCRVTEGVTGAAGGLVSAVCISREKGTPKSAVGEALLVRGEGLAGDAHAGAGHRQVSLLGEEQVQLMRRQGLSLAAGAFGENLLTRGIDLDGLRVGQHLRIGGAAILQVTQRGKECHTRCAIYHQVGDCIMPRHGLFGRVRRGGVVGAGAGVVLCPELERLRYAVVTLSDRRTSLEEDRSGGMLCEKLGALSDGELVARRLLPDDRARIEEELIRLCDEELCDLVVTTGGTGLSPRDVTPEATAAVIDRQIPGMSVAMITAGLRHTPRAMLSRAICGQRGSTLIVNLSGSPRAALEQLEVILPVLEHAVETASGIPQECGHG